VIDYFENPPNVGSLKRKRKDVGTGTVAWWRFTNFWLGIVGSIACGDQLKF